MSNLVAIIGGGPCGLTLARLLEVYGIDYIVFERDASPDLANRRGGSLDIHEGTGQSALREAGLFDDFLKRARVEDDRFTLYDKLGNQLTEVSGQGEDTAGGGRPEIDRADLRQILLSSIPEHKIRWNSTLKSVSITEGSSPVLTFADGKTESGFALVVGADGAWSKVRSAVSRYSLLYVGDVRGLTRGWEKMTSDRPEYSGRHYIETWFKPEHAFHPTIAKRIGLGTAAFLDGPEQIMAQRQGDGSYRMYYGIRVAEDFATTRLNLTDVDTTRGLLLSTFYKSWSDELREFIKQSDNFRSWPLYQLPLRDSSPAAIPGLTLAGDAAHLAVPNGEGVNCAMKDALELAGKLKKFGFENLATAVAEYEEDLFRRGQEHIADGTHMEKLMSDPRGPSVLLEFFSQHMPPPKEEYKE